MKNFFKGMTFGWHAERGDYRTEEAVNSLRKLRDTGCEWIALAFYTGFDIYGKKAQKVLQEWYITR